MIGAIIGLVLLGEIGVVIAAAAGLARAATFNPKPGWRRPTPQALAKVLYTDYLLLFQLAGLVLLVAMIGAIVLTLRHRPSVKRQDIAKQIGRKRTDAVELKDMRPGQGIWMRNGTHRSATISASRPRCSRSACSASS